MTLGVFGGSFDPIHNGHLFVAEAVREACALERILFVPNRAGPHRGPSLATPDVRGEMVRLAIAANPAFALDDSDLVDEATGFTVDLLPRLQARYPNRPLTFIAGSDSLVRARWHKLETILELLDAFVLAPRGEVSERELDEALAVLDPAHRAKVRKLDLPLVAESATLIRTRLAAGLSVRYLVPEPVYRYIFDRGLYR